LLPREDAVQSGALVVQDGVLVRPDLQEKTAGGAVTPPRSQTGAANASDEVQVIKAADFFIGDDLIVDGSACVGFDCVNGEVFGFDTIRLKENNLRIKFDDTSTAAGFPKNDWQLTANDSASGGQSKFSIDDITGSKTPFTVEASSPSNSIYVDSTGRIGFRTSTPVLDLHVSDSDTPGLRLEQNSSGGFAAQSWDVAGNETNFFIRDVTGGSRLPFRIRPGAPTNSIFIDTDGDVGIGTSSPAASLDVSRNAGALTTLARFANNSGIQVLYDRTDVGANDWQMSNFSSTFQMSIPGAATPQFSLGAGGNLTIGGTQYLTGSSRDLKENFVPVNGRDILQRLVEMPLTEWSAKTEPDQRHIGPVAEDWWSTFRLGPDDKHVSPTDIAGVALAAIKGLNQVVAEKDSAIAQLQQQNRALEARLAVIEQLLEVRREE